jgi:hypothetical protein
LPPYSIIGVDGATPSKNPKYANSFSNEIRKSEGSSVEVRRIRAFIFKQAGLSAYASTLRRMKPALQCTEQYLSLFGDEGLLSRSQTNGNSAESRMRV